MTFIDGPEDRWPEPVAQQQSEFDIEAVLADRAATAVDGALDTVFHLFDRQAHAGSRRGYLFQLLAGSVGTSLPALWAIRQLTLMIAGTDDPIIPVVNARIVHRMLPHSTLHISGRTCGRRCGRFRCGDQRFSPVGSRNEVMTTQADIGKATSGDPLPD